MRGRVEFEVQGKPAALHFTTNRLCRLEDITGRGVMDWAAALDGGGMSIRDLRALFAAGLDTAEPATLDQAGDMIDGLGMAEAGELIGRAMMAAFGSGDDGGADKVPGAGKK